nr:MAG TPA: hypothetical protein [Caudoviricetes sp.]
MWHYQKPITQFQKFKNQKLEFKISKNKTQEFPIQIQTKNHL